MGTSLNGMATLVLQLKPVVLLIADSASPPQFSSLSLLIGIIPAALAAV